MEERRCEEARKKSKKRRRQDVCKVLNNEWRPAVSAERRKLSTDLLCFYFFSLLSFLCLHFLPG